MTTARDNQHPFVSDVWRYLLRQERRAEFFRERARSRRRQYNAHPHDRFRLTDAPMSGGAWPWYHRLGAHRDRSVS